MPNTRTPVETAKQASTQPYPTSPAIGTLRFTGPAGAGEARVLAVLPPVRAGHGRRLRLHVTAPLHRGQRLRELDLQVDGADTLALGAEVRVVSSRPLVAERPKGQRGNRIRRAVRRWDAAAQRAKAAGQPEPPKPAEKRRDKSTAPKAQAGGKPAARGKRVPAAWSVIIEL